MNESAARDLLEREMTFEETLAAANLILPGKTSQSLEEYSPRWKATIAVGNFLPEHREEIWEFVLRWGGHEDEDLRDAIASVLLEHLLEHHFDFIFPRIDAVARSQPLFADMFCRCWKFGQSELPGNAKMFDSLQIKYRDSSGQ